MFINSIKAEEIEKLDILSFPGKVYIIDSLGKEFNEAIRYLKTQKLLGFDTESKPTFLPKQPRCGVALLQLSGESKAYLFRVKTIGMHEKLCALLSNPRILKIGAAVFDDVRGLQKLNKFKAHGFIDLQKIVGDYGITDISVKKMAAIILGVKISKAQQLSNWEAELLTEAQIAYAATDAWICRQMYKKLRSVPKNKKEDVKQIDVITNKATKQGNKKVAKKNTQQKEQKTKAIKQPKQGKEQQHSTKKADKTHNKKYLKPKQRVLKHKSED